MVMLEDFFKLVDLTWNDPIAPFWGGKHCGVDVPLKPQTVASGPCISVLFSKTMITGKLFLHIGGNVSHIPAHIVNNRQAQFHT